MELEAKVIQIDPIQSGTSKAGKQWQSRDIIVETLSSYPKKVKLKFFGDKNVETAAALRNGQVYTFHIDIESREYNGRWYTEATCYRVREGVGETTQAAPQSSPQIPGQAYGQPYGSAPAQDYPQNQGYPQSQTYTPPASYGQPSNPGQQRPGLFPDSETSYRAPGYTDPNNKGDDLPF